MTDDDLMRIAAENEARKSFTSYLGGDNAHVVIDALLSEIATLRLLIADLSQDGRNVQAYRQGVEEGKRIMKATALLAIRGTQDALARDVDRLGGMAIAPICDAAYRSIDRIE